MLRQRFVLIVEHWRAEMLYIDIWLERSFHGFGTTHLLFKSRVHRNGLCAYMCPEHLSDSFSRTPEIRFLVELPSPDRKTSFSEEKPLSRVVLSFVETYDVQIPGMPS